MRHDPVIKDGVVSLFLAAELASNSRKFLNQTSDYIMIIASLILLLMAREIGEILI